MFRENMPGNKINSLGNGFENDFLILKGEIDIKGLRLEDVLEIVEYGWDRNDLQRMLDARDYSGIGYLAAWIRECGNSAHGMMVEDDQYCYPLDDEGNYLDEAFGRCC